MINRKNFSDESVFFAVTAIAICAVLVAAVAGLVAPAAANPGVSTSTNSTATYASPTGYFPDQFVNQAKEIEPMPKMYY